MCVVGVSASRPGLHLHLTIRCKDGIKNMLARPLHIVLATLGIAVTRPAFADDPRPKVQPVAVDLDRLSAQLDLFSAEERRERWAAALTGGGVGSIMLPTGIILLRRADGASEALAIGLIAGGGAQLLSVPAGFLRTRMDGVRDDFRRRWLFGHEAGEETLRAVEEEWRAAAVAAHHFRTLVGATVLIFGAVNLVAGVVLLLAPAGILGLDRSAQYTWGGTLLGFGASVGTIGVGLSIEESAEERSWNAYQLMMAPHVLPSVSLGVSPIRGGGMGVAALSF